ncbi:hypothetical protein QYF36_015143 [Acer negundo]|nr:hypothetical protein QYF36_015143 [Acer negundo]
MIETALSVAAKVVEYLVKIALALSVVAAKVVEYLVEIALALPVVAAKVVEYLFEIARPLVPKKVKEFLVEIALSFVAGIALSLVAKKVGDNLAKKVVDCFAKKVVDYLVKVALSVAAKVARPFEIFAINRREEGINNDEGTDQIEFKQLRSLRLNSLPKLTGFCSINGNKDMVDTTTLLFSQKSLKYLFPVSIAKSLSELEKLHVHHCEVLEEIVRDDQEEATVADTFVFPRVTSLKLEYLPRLKVKTLYHGVHTSKTLVVCGFDKFESFASELFDFQENKV